MANERNDETEQLLQKIKELSEKNATLEQIIALQKVKENSGNNESKSTKTRVDIMTPKQVWDLLSDKKRLKGVELYFESGNNNFVLDGKRLPKEYFDIYESNKNNRGFNENIFIILTRDLAITPKIQLSPEEKTIQDVQDALALDEYNKKRISLSEKIDNFKDKHDDCIKILKYLLGFLFMCLGWIGGRNVCKRVFKMGSYDSLDMLLNQYNLIIIIIATSCCLIASYLLINSIDE